VYWNWANTPSLASSFIVESVSGGISIDSRVTPLTVEIWYIHYNGVVMGRKGASETFQPFDGEKPIQDLKMYPARFHKDVLTKKDVLPRKLQFERDGKAFFQLCKSKGHYRMLRGRPFTKKCGLKSMVHGRVVVDIDTYFEDPDMNEVSRPTLMADNDSEDDQDDTSARTGCRCIHCGKKPRQRKGTDWTKFDNIRPDESPPIDNNLFYRLCYVLVKAYLLKDRKWEEVHVSDLHEVSFNENLLDSLVLPSGIKNTVQALAWNSSQRTLDTFSADFIEGKGNGQIILLHGAPGVGKTATAGKLLILFLMK
jgi:hypothetical protein